MQKTLIAIAACVVAGIASSTGAQAQARPFSPGLMCGDVADLVSLNGARVISTGSGTYDRYVASRNYCAQGESTKPAWVLTADSPQCFIGYTCEPVYGRGRR